MTTHDGIDPREPLLDGVAAIPADAFGPDMPPPGLDDAVLARTLPAIRRRALRRRFLIAAALLATFGAGWGARGFAGTGPPGGARDADSSPPPVAVTVPDPASTQEAAPPPARPLPVLAAELKEAGDRFLREDGDVRSALECYRQHLEIAGSLGPVRPGPEDSWLLAALKKPRS